MIFGPPKAETVPRYSLENKEEGFYNFLYIENYKNLFISYQIEFLKFLQVKNYILDITVLETVREVLFVGLIWFYSQSCNIRISSILTIFILIRILFPWLSAAAVWIRPRMCYKESSSDPQIKYY
jgi:hypothetical protein